MKIFAFVALGSVLFVQGSKSRAEAQMSIGQLNAGWVGTYALSVKRCFVQLVNSIFPKVTNNCWKEMPQTRQHLPHWRAGESHSISYLERAPSNCLSPGFPILWVSNSTPRKWIQVVHINVAPPQPSGEALAGLDLIPKKNDWTFVDISEENRKSGTPFYNQQFSDYWDNPSWGCGPFQLGSTVEEGKQLEWRASLFSVEVDGMGIRPVGGIRWGYNLSPRGLEVSAERVTVETPASWNALRSHLKDAFGKWNFLEAK